MFEDSYLDKYFKFDIPPLKISPFEINKECEKIQLKELETLLDEDDYKFIDNSKNLLPKVNITDMSKNININTKKSTNTKKMKRKQTPKSSTLNKKINKSKNDIQLLNKSGILPPGHRIARGRARPYQKSNMTPEQLEAEKIYVKEKNRLAAKKFRSKKREYIINLEEKLEKLEKIILDQEKEIKKLEKIKLNLTNKIHN